MRPQPSNNPPVKPGNDRKFHPRRKKRHGFKSRPTRQTSAGGIIFRRNKGGRVEILFLKREDGRWTFPKGKQQLGESFVVAAIREIREETGIADLRYVAPLGFTAFKYLERHQGPVKPVAKTVHFFLFEAPSDAQEHIPGTEGIVEASWIRADRAFASMSYRNMDRILAKALRLIVEEERG
jgi:8-oxo-dGTP pyrophosphatase MutT (NUDIX family)